MMALQFLYPIVAGVLYVIVFQKAGFRGALLAVCAVPLVGSAVSYLLFRALVAGGGGMMMMVPLVSIPLSLAPLLVLAFMTWPPVSAASGLSEKSQ